MAMITFASSLESRFSAKLAYTFLTLVPGLSSVSPTSKTPGPVEELHRDSEANNAAVQ